MVVGLDLNNKTAQLSIMRDMTAGPVTISYVAGEEKFEIPVALAKVDADGSWLFGNEALLAAKNNMAELVEDIFNGAVMQDTLTMKDEEYAYVDLMLLFVNRVISLMSFYGDWKKCDRFVICVPTADDGTIQMIKAVSAELSIDSDRVDIISRAEAFYEFVIHQKEELWNRDVVALDYSLEGVMARCMTVDRRTRPAVCRLVEQFDSALDVYDDEALLDFCKVQMEGRIVNSVYLVGNPVTEDEIGQTLRYLCMKRRVFAGYNLYTKGACFAAWDREYSSEVSKKYLFLGRDMLKSNIGLRLVRQNEEYYEPIVDAGINWYDVSAVKEFYLSKEKEIRLLLTPLTGRNEHYAVVRLADFPTRPERTTRVRLALTMSSDDTAKIEVTDLGFGEIFPGSGKKVVEEVKLLSELDI